MIRLFAVLSLAILTACDPPASGPATVTPAAPAAPLSDWPVTRGGPTLTGRVDAEVFSAPVIEWSLDLGNPIVAEAAVADGAIVVGDVMGVIHCIDLATRTQRWKFETGDTIQAAAAISNGRVFLGSGDKRFLALDLATGEKLWAIEAAQKFPSAANLVPAPDGSGDWILVNGYDGIARCLRAADGSEVWSYQTDDYINGTPAVMDDGRLVAFGGCDKVIHVLNLADGTLVNEVVTDAQIINSVATAGSTIYSANHANQLVATEAHAPALTWIYKSTDFPFTTTPAVDATHVYLGSRDKSLHAVVRSSGEAAWTFKTGGRVESSPLAFNNAIVFASNDGRLYAANPADGAELWRLDLGEDLTAAPIFAQGRLIIGGGRGTLFVISRQPD